MGLSERKQKQRISYDPRNLTWSDDKDRFSYKHMKSLGWTDASGIGGANLTGNAKHIAVVHKLDSAGIGMARAMKEGDELGGQARAGLDDVLRRLASASVSASATASPSASPSGSPAPESAAGEVTPAKLRNRIASRQRHLQAKRLASSSPAALAEILGISASALPSPKAEPIDILVKQEITEPGPSSPSPPANQPIRIAEDMVTTSTLSVSDYFRQKMRARAMARQGLSGEAVKLEPEAPVASGSTTPAREWEGTKVAFGEADAAPVLAFTEVADEPANGTVVTTESKEEEKAAKTARKLEKEARREARAKRKAEKLGVKREQEEARSRIAGVEVPENSKEARKAARKAAKAAVVSETPSTDAETKTLATEGKKRKRA